MMRAGGRGGAIRAGAGSLGAAAGQVRTLAGAPYAYLGLDHVRNPGGATSLTLTAPALTFAATADDVVIAAAMGRGNTNRTITPPPGWTEVHQDWQVFGEGLVMGAYWSPATAAVRAGGQSWALDAAEEWAVCLTQYRGLDPSNPIDAWSKYKLAADATAGVPIAVPSVNALASTRALLVLTVLARGSSFTFDAALTELEDHDTGGSGASTTATVGLALQPWVAGAGATGTRAVTPAAGSCPIMALMIALRGT